MIKTKTKKKILTIFSAILGAVFALLTGITYCASSLSLSYGMNGLSTSAYIGNQQFQIINDTTNNPIPYGIGVHNFEVALQYSVSYDFDISVKYALSWSGTDSTEDNVVLHFANRDNIIYDESYIFLAESVTAGSGKITLITGAEFIDLAGKNYDKQTLTITILDSNVKIYKAQTTYSLTHPLATEATQSTAGQAWIRHKINSTSTTTTNAYAMVYNFRRNYAMGIEYPKLETAYEKPVATEEVKNGETVTQEIGRVYGPTWSGGNRYYAGTGLYVIAGSTDIELEIQVGGIWRTLDKVDISSENNIQYNYSDNWDWKEYSSNNLWDIRTFKYKIPAKSAYYIDVLESIEITCAAGSITNFTGYHLVTNQIIINPLQTNKVEISYSETNGKLITYTPISSNGTATGKTSYNDETLDRSISIINTTQYNNGLYDTYNNGSESLQTFAGNITLINNTADTRLVTIDINLYFHINNAGVTLYAKTGDNAYLRAIDLIDRATTTIYKPQDAFNATKSEVSTLYYSYTGTCDALSAINDQTGVTSVSIKLAPYSSASVVSSYIVTKTLKDFLITSATETGFDDPSTTDRIEYFDAWTYLIPEISVSETVSTVGDDESVKTHLMLETTQTSTETVISVKNNTNNTVTGIELQNLVIKEYYEAVQNTETKYLESIPYDWNASYWKYYDKDNNQLDSVPATFQENTYWLKTKIYSSIDNSSIDYLDSFNSSTTLLPGESIQVATVATANKIYISGTCSATSVVVPSEVTIINNGTKNPYIVNYNSSTSYYLRVGAKLSETDFPDFVVQGDYSYYIGILRPGQIIKLSFESATEIELGTNDLISTNTEYNSTLLTSTYGWDATAVGVLTSYFDINKASTQS